MLDNMPNEVGCRILSYLTKAALLHCLSVCTTWQATPAFVAHVHEIACKLAAKNEQKPTRSTTLNWQAVANAYSNVVGTWFEESLNPESLWNKTSGLSHGLFWVSFQVWNFFRVTLHFGSRGPNKTPANEVRFTCFLDLHFDIRMGDPCFGSQLPAQITCEALCTAQKVILSGFDIPSFDVMVTFRSLERLDIENCRFTDGTALGELGQLKMLKQIRIRACQNKARQYVGIVVYIRSNTDGDDGTQTAPQNTPRDVTGRGGPWQSPNVGNAKLNVTFAEQKEDGRAVLCDMEACVESFYADAGVGIGMKLVTIQGIDVDHKEGFKQARKLLKCALWGENRAERIWLGFKGC